MYEPHNDLFKLYFCKLTQKERDAGHIETWVPFRSKGWRVISISFDPEYVQWRYEALPEQIECAAHRIRTAEDREKIDLYRRIYDVCERVFGQSIFERFRMTHPVHIQNDEQSIQGINTSMDALLKHLHPPVAHAPPERPDHERTGESDVES
ncbi:MAG: hypothetical protein KGR16_00860 [Verrucomicrobia bacterium]|nr:hypothetical protein [Verrucomicrobiota bacterium]MDE3047651.1 hypothetical protein [Verrucomicrobiota bacterium]